jgi:hypothetical protein
VTRMSAEDMGRLLAKCASYDRRKVGEADIIAWLQVLGDLAYDDCAAAVIAHYGETTDWIMPAHVRSRVREIRRQRIQDADMPPPPPELLDDTTAWRAAVRAAAIAVADGRDPEAAMQAIARTARPAELEA